MSGTLTEPNRSVRDTASKRVAIGIGDGLYVRLEGTVTIDRDGRGVFDGTDVIESITGKHFDTGIIAILIG